MTPIRFPINRDTLFSWNTYTFIAIKCKIIIFSLPSFRAKNNIKITDKINKFRIGQATFQSFYIPCNDGKFTLSSPVLMRRVWSIQLMVYIQLIADDICVLMFTFGLFQDGDEFTSPLLHLLSISQRLEG